MKPEEKPEYWKIRKFRRWVKAELAMREMTQKQFAKSIGTYTERISEAINGKTYGARFIPIIIDALGGNIEEFVKDCETNKGSSVGGDQSGHPHQRLQSNN